MLKPNRTTITLAAPAAALALLITGCASHNQRTFASPQEGAQGLTSALRAGDAEEVRAILGPDGEELISSGDDVEDRNQLGAFLATYDQRHEVVTNEDGTATIIVGSNEWPLPIPLVEEDDGWRFDTRAGKDEILARRIGRNELSTIETCRAIVDAQREYYASDPNGDGHREYARKFISDTGTRNGLYWPIADGQFESPLGPLVGLATDEGYVFEPSASTEPRPYNGYCYRILTGQGRDAPGGARSYVKGEKLTEGFAVVAYPYSYDNSGVMTFITREDGVVYQRDLGRGTESAARSMSVFNPDSRWEIVR